MSKEVTRLLRIMSQLRKKCPWDKKQTHQSLISCLENESKEVIETIHDKDFHGMREELGDLLLQVVFHSLLANEKGKFNFDDVVKTLNRKLIRRHPHVFAKTKELQDAETVLKQWNEIKAKEKRDKRHARNRRR
jgi:MazG family protein